jgi:hypothetical protein
LKKLEKLQRLQIIYKNGSDRLEILRMNWKWVDFRYVSNYDYTLGQIKFKTIED